MAPCSGDQALHGLPGLPAGLDGISVALSGTTSPTIFDKVRATLIVLATPIYSWYCTPPMKALLDRLVYGMDKYYGAQRYRAAG